MHEQQEKDDRTVNAAGTAPLLQQWAARGLLRNSSWLVLFVCLLASWFAWHSATVTVTQAKQDYFDFRVREAVTRIMQRMQAYQQVLLGVQGLYEASANVERQEFKSYVDALDLADNYPGIQGVGFSLIIPARHRERHVSAIRKQGFPGYTIRPDGPRDPYTAIIYLEPFTNRNLRAFGYDMFSEPVRRTAMEQARDHGRMAMSGKVRLVQESGGQEQAGFLLYLPIYRNGTPTNTPAQRQANIVGWAYSPFRMNDLMQGIHGEHASDLDIEIYDGKDTTAETLMYDSDGVRTAGIPSRSSPGTTSSIEIAGHPWTIHIRAREGIQSRVDTNRPVLIAVAGVVISFLLSWLTWSLVTARESAIRAVQERERLIAELQKALAEIKTMQGIIPICSVCKKIRDDKDAWKQLETFISEHSDAVFSHGYCPECAQKAMEEIRQFTKKQDP